MKKKSKFFEGFAPKDKNNKALKGDLELLLSSEEELVTKCREIVDLIQRLHQLGAELCPKMSRRRACMASIQRMVRCLVYFSAGVNDPKAAEDTPEMWADDLIRMKYLNESRRDSFVKIANTLKTS
ncbi:MAG: hypothetical protein HQL51_05395 [Magnetococcales bacterium]|nr:hypothetical protein [Magnetococcales bacterium]